MPRKKVEKTEEVKNEVIIEDVEKIERPVNPKLNVQTVKDSEGRLVSGIISGDGKSITTLAGVTFSL